MVLFLIHYGIEAGFNIVSECINGIAIKSIVLNMDLKDFLLPQSLLNKSNAPFSRNSPFDLKDRISYGSSLAWYV
jgi:hypothetical protein